MATKLKGMKLTSVDLVRAGANQEADICLYKGDDEQAQKETNLFKRFMNWPQDNEPQEAETVEKDYATFDQINDNRESQDKLWRYTDALTCSIRSIQEDRDLDGGQKADMMKTSLQQFASSMEQLIDDLCKTAPAEPVVKADPDYDLIEEI